MDTKTKVVGGFLLGAALGAAAGILMAPQSGRRTRRKIKAESKRLTEDMMDTAKELLIDAKLDYQKKLGKLKKGGKKSIERISKAVSSP